MWGHADIPTIHNRGAVADPANNHRYGRIEQNTNYLNLQPLRGCIFFGDCRYPHVADCASLIVNVGLLRLQPLRGCASVTFLGVFDTPLRWVSSRYGGRGIKKVASVKGCNLCMVR